MQLKLNIQQQLMVNMGFRQELATHRKIDTPSALKLIRKNSELLTTMPVVDLIKKHTGENDLTKLFDFTNQN